MVSYNALTVSACNKLVTDFNSKTIRVGVIDVSEARLYSILDNIYRIKFAYANFKYINPPKLLGGFNVIMFYNHFYLSVTKQCN